MLKVPKISAHNSDSFKSALGLTNAGNMGNMTNTNINEKNKSNNISQINEHHLKDNFNQQIINTNYTLNKSRTTLKENSFVSNNYKLSNPLMAEVRLKELETKLISVEKTNLILNDKVRTHERNFDLELRQIQQN